MARGTFYVSVLMAGLAVSAATPGQIVKVGKAYRLRAKYTVAQTFRYGFDTLVTQLGANAKSKSQNIALPIVMTVIQMQGGVARIRTEVGPWKVNGEKFRDKQTIVVHVDSLNRIVHGPPTEVPHFSIQLPEKPLKIGQSWSSIVNTAGATPQAVQVKATYTLKAVSGGRATIGVGYSGASANKVIQTSGSGTVYLSTKDASLISMNVSQTVSLRGGIGAKTQIAVKRVG